MKVKAKARGDTLEQTFESFNNPIGYPKSVYMSHVTSLSQISAQLSLNPVQSCP
jgi:hypothetical protein